LCAFTASDVITHSAHPAGPQPGVSGRKHRSLHSPRPGHGKADELRLADVSGLGQAEGVQDPMFQCEVLLGCAFGRPGRPQHGMRLPDHFTGGELLACEPPPTD
jgi:hypothetical protein